MDLVLPELNRTIQGIGVSKMRRLRKGLGKLAAALFMATMILTACGSGITDEMLAARESAIAMMDNGDYEGAVAQFNSLVDKAESVTDFELDILKYRAEAEYKLGDYAAAAYTYNILGQVDGEKAEYCYFSAMALAKAGDLISAQEMLEAGGKLDKDGEKTGFAEALTAIADAMVESDDFAGAKALYQNLIDAGHGNTGIYNQLMLISMDAGDYSEALKMSMKGQILTDGIAMKELKFNEAVCYEYLGDFSKALELFRAYVAEYGSDERAEHEIAFLETR